MRVLAIAFLATAAAVQADVFESFSVSGKADNQSYEFTARKAELAKTPVWPRDAEHPPLSLRRAEDIARRQLRQLVPSSAGWVLQGITLSPVGDDLHWIYTVEFTPPVREDVAEFGRDYMRLLVLLDGSVVTPKITPIPK